jgi:hypothetical protein
MVAKCFRFDTTRKKFVEVPQHYELDGATDAVGLKMGLVHRPGRLVLTTTLSPM